MRGQFNSSGALSALDARITANATAIASLGVKRLDITIASNAWTENQTTHKYEYTGSDTHVTANTYIEGILDEENAAKFEDGYINSASGSFTIVTSTAPESSVSMTLLLVETEDVTPSGVGS